ncbi:hypothetical protein H7I53_25430 [Mycolicibacterium pulveris]|uniref:Mce-associated membrane protein n=1 Tax=Mycolicibacterium pulveris TaxID=36813 RepID=A0A7I7UPS1_MYCPV|nr:hypothetical protein [Mycolicibacterium pulveris]MCV6983546.1 hypothetical protein [Mycolicibacterium pulveris]BBY83425.1 hypothetical protein MPUL_45830 [Mycolicibacterium pulveris]
MKSANSTPPEQDRVVGAEDAMPQEDSPAATDGDQPRAQTSSARRVSIAITARGLILAVVIAALAVSASVFAWLFFDAQAELDQQAQSSENNARAEKIALDYAVDAAAMDFKDLNGWKVKLVAGTSPDLNDKLSEAASSMEQILVPLQWTSTATPLAAKVRSADGGVYVVDCFVSVQTKTVQSSDPLQSTATYSVVIDSDEDWQITDVGGIGAVLGQS